MHPTASLAATFGAGSVPASAPGTGAAATTPFDVRTVDGARDEIVVTSTAGAPFLLAFGTTLLACAFLPLVLPLETAVWVVMFQGNLALPLAFWLERRMAPRAMSPDNPLKSLSVQLAMTQILAIPAVLIANSYHPALVPAAFAAIGGGHFLPYAWLQRTRLYVVLGVLVSLGALAITLALKREAFPWVLGWMSVLYFVFAALLVRHARRHAAQTEARRITAAGRAR